MDRVGPQSDRVEWLDAVRGFALLGILLANILYWSGWLFMTPPQRVALAGEAGAGWETFLHRLFIDGKFYTLFSLLFGLGFALQRSGCSAAARTASVSTAAERLGFS
jgi:uncharacterized protein